MIYLDNSSSTQPKFFAKDYSDYWMNTNSFYSHKEQQALENAKDRIKKCIGVNSGKVIFGRCSTELVEWLSRQIPCFCTDVEHDSCYDVCSHSKYPYEAIGESKVIFIHQSTNQVTGKCYDIEAIGKKCHEQELFFGVDAVASIGHYHIPKDLETFCDCWYFSGHKAMCEKGIGAMWLSDALCDRLSVSNSPRNNHSTLTGTTALPSILALTDALEYTISNFPKNEAKYRELHDYMFHYAMSKGLYIYEKIEDSCPAINAITIPFVNGDALSNYLASKEIYVGRAGSACSEEHDFRVLKAFDYTEEQCENTVRVSFSEDNTLKDVEVLVDSIIEFKNKF